MYRHVALGALLLPLLLALALPGEEEAEPAEEAPAPESYDGASVSIDVAIVEHLGGEGTDAAWIDSLKKVDEWIELLDDRNKLLSLTRVTVSTVDGRRATSQFGEQAAIVTGRQRVAVQREVIGDEQGRRVFARPAAQTLRSYSMQELGTLVRATPHLMSDETVAVKLQVERSALSAVRPPVDLEEDALGQAPPQPIVRLTAESTLRLKDAKTRIAYRKSATSPHGLIETVVLVTARVGDRAEAPPPAEEPESGRP